MTGDSPLPITKRLINRLQVGVSEKFNLSRVFTCANVLVQLIDRIKK